MHTEATSYSRASWQPCFQLGVGQRRLQQRMVDHLGDVGVGEVGHVGPPGKGPRGRCPRLFYPPTAATAKFVPPEHPRGSARLAHLFTGLRLSGSGERGISTPRCKPSCCDRPRDRDQAGAFDFAAADGRQQ